jgi:glycerol uptake facilitator-like aquaporin
MVVQALFTTGLGYGIGVVLALSVCASTSGGHFSPAMTIVAMLFKGFPVKKGFGYIIAQIFGAYVAFGFVYLQWRPTILVSTIYVCRGNLSLWCFPVD